MRIDNTTQYSSKVMEVYSIISFCSTYFASFQISKSSCAYISHPQLKIVLTRHCHRFHHHSLKHRQQLTCPRTPTVCRTRIQKKGLKHILPSKIAGCLMLKTATPNFFHTSSLAMYVLHGWISCMRVGSRLWQLRLSPECTTRPSFTASY